MLFDKKPSFRSRNRLSRFFARIFSKRRKEHLVSRVFQVAPRLKSSMNSRQKLILILSVVAVSIIVGFVKFSGFFEVKKVTILRSSLELPLQEVEAKVNELVFEKNIFSIDTASLQKAIRDLVLDASRVEISKNYPAEIQVEIFKFPIIAELRLGTEQIFLNENGYQVTGELPSNDILTITLGENLELEDLQRQLVEPQHLSAMRDAVFYFESLTDLKVLSVKYFPVCREIHLKASENFDVWIDLTSDYRSQIDKLKIASEKLNLENTGLEYVDLRIRNKIFYKEKK